MLQPRKVKYRKHQRGRMKGKAHSGNTVHFGEVGLQALEPAWITARQIESGRRAIVRHLKRGGKVWIRIFPAKPYTQRAAESRMGKGKGGVEYYVATVKPGRVMFEVGGLPADIAVSALKHAQYKFPIKTKIVARSDETGEQA